VRLGIISDTHGTLPNEVFDVFKEVDHIVHAGDIGSLEILTELEAVAPVTAVFGNTDGFPLRERVPQVARAEFEGLYLRVTHGDQFGTPTPEGLVKAFPDADIIVFGHTHRPVLSLLDKTITVMNPGSASHPRGDGPPSVGIMELEVGLPPRARLVPLG
jgi:putative phosphoesterase